MLAAASLTPPPSRPSAEPGWRTEAAIIAGLLGCSLVLDQFRILNTFVFSTLASYLTLLADAILRLLVSVPPMAIALHASTRLPGQRWRRHGTAIVVMVGAAALSAGLSTYGLPYEPIFVSVGASASTTVALWYDLWVRILVGLLALSIVDSLCVRRRAADRLAERQERSRVLRQQLAYAQLRAIQARVDPQLLFDMLAAVKRYYEQDAARAEKLLDELTAFLRAALPRLRSARSSLEVEFGLVGCYVRMLRAAGDTEIELQASLPPALADAVFPAGMLLPLMTRPRPEAAGAARRIGLDVQAEDEGGPLRVRMTDVAAPDPLALERLRASLADLYGDRARLRVLPLDAAGAGIEMEVPRERD